MFGQDTTLASNEYNKMIKQNPELNEGFTGFNTPEFKAQWEQSYNSSNSEEELGMLASLPVKEFSKALFTSDQPQPIVRFGAFDDAQESFYDDYTLNQFKQEFPNDPPLGSMYQGTWHGASRIPKGKHEGRYLKKVGHPTLHLALLSDLHYHDPPKIPEGVAVKDISEDVIDGRPNPHRIYYTEENGQRTLYSFPRNKQIDPRFKPIEPEYLNMLLEQAYFLPELQGYIMDNEIPNRRIPGKVGNTYKIYADSGKDKYLTIGIGHLLDPRKPDSITRTRRMLQTINPLLNTQAIMKGEQGLTQAEVHQLFQMDIREKTETTHRVFPNLHTYPDYIQVALIDATYWGMMGHSPTTRKLIKLGRLEEARDEWLRNKTYKRGESRFRFEKFDQALKRWIEEKARFRAKED